MNLYDALLKWLSAYSFVNSWVYFNVVDVAPENVSLLSESGEQYLQKYIDGSADCELPFAIVLMKYYDSGTSDINMQAMEECESLIKWIHEQEIQGNFPDFGDCVVDEVKILDSAPSLAVDQSQNLAKYQMQGTVLYLKKKGV